MITTAWHAYLSHEVPREAIKPNTGEIEPERMGHSERQGVPGYLQPHRQTGMCGERHVASATYRSAAEIDYGMTFDGRENVDCATAEGQHAQTVATQTVDE